jgi:hypothetical protein
VVSAALEVARSLDPVRLLDALEVEPDPWQAEALRSGAPRQLYNCARQTGKSTVAGTLAAHTALYRPESLTLLLSPTLRQSQELFRKALGVYRANGRPVAPEAETALSLTLENGSRVLSLPGSSEGSIRGFSGVDLLIVDEASRVANELYSAVRPMLAVSGGRLLALSTPFGSRGWWWEAWESREPWERYRITAEQCPRIPEVFLAEERRTLGDWWYRQEYLCEFLDPQGAVFTREEVEAALTEGLEEWDWLP